MDVPHDRLVGLLCSWTDSALRFERVDQVGSWDAAESFLRMLTHPPTRFAVIGSGSASFVVGNGRSGADPADLLRVLARTTSARCARVVDAPARVWTDGVERETLSYAARILEYYGRSGSLERSVACADDGGRWRYSESGTPHAIEREFNTTARRTRDRFTSANLHSLVTAFALPVLTRAQLARSGQVALVRAHLSPSSWAAEVEQQACTIEEANAPAFGYLQRGLGWVAHGPSHAASVLADLERAVRLNPAFESAAKPHLEAARRELARQRRDPPGAG